MAERLRGLKQRELQKCVACDRGVAHDNGILFFRVALERRGLKLDAVRRQHALEMFFGGASGDARRDGPAAALAHVMGPNDDLAIPLHAPAEVLICDECALNMPLLVIWELVIEKKKPADNPELAPASKPASSEATARAESSGAGLHAEREKDG